MSTVRLVCTLTEEVREYDTAGNLIYYARPGALVEATYELADRLLARGHWEPVGQPPVDVPVPEVGKPDTAEPEGTESAEGEGAEWA